MRARLDLDIVRQLCDSFPGKGWQQIETSVFIAERGERLFSNWMPTKALEGHGGVYAILLPVKWFSPQRIMPLHAPHRHRGIPIEFEFSLDPFTQDGYGIAYVGKTTNLRQRWRGHLSPGDRKDGGQVKFGLFDCKCYEELSDALRALRQHARMIYTVLSGPEHNAPIATCSKSPFPRVSARHSTSNQNDSNLQCAYVDASSRYYTISGNAEKQEHALLENTQ